MQYQFTERREYIKTIEFFNSLPLEVERIKYFKEEEISGTFIKKEFCYSFDNASWSNWNTLSLNNLCAIQFKDQLEFWLKVRYTRDGIGAANILRWYLIYDGKNPTPPVPPIDSSLDAWTLRGEGPDYYLDRQNHFGPYTGIIVENIADDSSSSIGVYSGRIDSSTGTTFEFKRIKGGEGVDLKENSGIIQIDVSGNTFINPDPVTESIGGIHAGDTFFDGGKTFEETMQAMFYPTRYPSFTSPSTTLTHNVNSLMEIGTIIDIAFRSSLSRGAISPAYGTSGLRSGLGNTVYFTGVQINGSIGNYPNNPYIAHATNYLVNMGVQTWTSAWLYDSGEQPKDSNGNNYSTPLAAGTTGYSSASFEGVYPLYATTVSTTNPDTKQPLVSMLTGNNIELNLVAETTGKQSFDIPKAWEGSPTNRPLIGIDQFFPLPINAWNPIAFSSFTKTSVVHNTVNYWRYTYNGPIIGARKIRLKF